MKIILEILLKIAIIGITVSVANVFISDPQLTCIEAGGSFNANMQICEGLEQPFQFLQILRRETLFLTGFSSLLTIILLALAKRIMKNILRS